MESINHERTGVAGGFATGSAVIAACRRGLAKSVSWEPVKPIVQQQKQSMKIFRPWFVATLVFFALLSGCGAVPPAATPDTPQDAAEQAVHGTAAVAIPDAYGAQVAEDLARITFVEQLERGDPQGLHRLLERSIAGSCEAEEPVARAHRARSCRSRPDRSTPVTRPARSAHHLRARHRSIVGGHH